MDAGNSWQVEMKGPTQPLHVLLVAAIETSIGRKWKLRLSASLLPLVEDSGTYSREAAGENRKRKGKEKNCHRLKLVKITRCCSRSCLIFRSSNQKFLHDV
ncbi:hypothetical protein Ancab_035909 [Ancistrocladus abbreviatus]